MATLNYQHILTYNGVSKTLDAAPAGWDEFTRRYYRHLTFHGILMSDATSQRFVLSGGESDDGGYYFIDNAFELEGVKAVIYYTRKRLDEYTKKFVTDYTGILDFSPDSGYSKEDEWIEVKTIDNSKLQSFVSNKNKDYDLNSVIATNGNTIESFSDSPKRATYDTTYVYLEARSSGLLRIIDNVTETTSGTATYNRDYEINRIGERIIEEQVAKIYDNTSDDTIDLTLELTGSVSYSTTFTPVPETNNRATTRVITYLRIRDIDDNIIEEVELSRSTEDESNLTAPLTITTSDTISYDVNYDMLEGYYIEFVTEFTVTIFQNMEVSYDWETTVSDLFIYEKYRYLGSDAFTYLPFEVASRLIQLMTGELDTDKLITSEILGRTDSEFEQYASDGELAYLGTTSAWALRNYPEYTIKVNFEDWFKTVDYMDNITLWFDKANDKFRIEKKEQAYRNEEILNLGEVKNLKKTIHKGSYFTTINSGTVEKGDYEEVNGALEYNIQSNHSLDMPSSSKKTLRTIYNTDTLSALFAKQDGYYAYGSEDTRHDDKIMLVDLDSNLTTIPNSDIGNYTGFLGVDERWNGSRTPRKNIIKNGNHLGACLYKEVDGVIQFTGNIKDIIIEYDGVSESDDITKSELGEPLYYPEVYDFEAYVDHNTITQLDLDPHGYITFNDYNGNEYKGFILEIEIQDFSRTANFKLLRLNPNR